jgi:O-antigen ligase
MSRLLRLHFANWTELVIFLARCSAILAVFALPLYPGIVKIALPVASVLSVVAGNGRSILDLIKKQRVVTFALGLLLFFFIAIFYSHTSWHDAGAGFFKYNKLLYIPFLIPLFKEPQWRRYALNALIAACLLDMAIYILSVHSLLAVNYKLYPGGYAVYRINTTVLLGFIMFVFLQRISDREKFWWLYLVLFFLSGYVLFFIYDERNGQLVFFLLLALFFWQRWRGRGLALTLLVIPILGVTLFFTSPTFNTKAKAIWQETYTYSQGGNQVLASVDARMAFTQYSWQIIKRYPLFGGGTGSFKKLYAATKGPISDAPNPLQDPHEEYILIAVQLGLIGLIYFLFWLALTWVESRFLPKAESRLMQGVMMSFIASAFCNSALFIAMSGLFYVIFLSVFFAAD